MARDQRRRKHHVPSIPDNDAKGEVGCRAQVGRNETLVGQTELLSAVCLTFALVELLLGTLCFFQVCTAQRYPMRAWLDLALCWCKRLRQFAAISSKPGRHRCVRMRQDFEISPVAAPSALVPRLGGQLCIFGIQPLEGTSGTCGPCRRWYIELNEVGIASALMTNRRMVFPDKSGNHCWHAVRVYLRSRMQRAPESGVERWGSLLHDLWDVKAGWHPARMVSRLHIREAGVQGSSTDENLVHEIALLLHMSRNMNPFVQRPSLAVPRALVLPDFVVRHGLQVNGIDANAWRVTACPSTLLAGTAAR